MNLQPTTIRIDPKIWHITLIHLVISYVMKRWFSKRRESSAWINRAIQFLLRAIKQILASLVSPFHDINERRSSSNGE